MGFLARAVAFCDQAPQVGTRQGGGIRMPSFTESIKVGNQDMALYAAVPSGTGPFPAIVVIQHGGGVDTFVRTMVDRLATAGYAAVAPDLYHRLGPGVERTIRQLKDLEIIADVQATVHRSQLKGLPK